MKKVAFSAHNPLKICIDCCIMKNMDNSFWKTERLVFRLFSDTSE
jgi:hypothetical protein